jgi:hypothetical protein
MVSYILRFFGQKSINKFEDWHVGKDYEIEKIIG